MKKGRLIKLKFESMMSMESSNHHMSLVTLINEVENKQLTFVCDRYVCDQFVLRDSNDDSASRRLLPEVLVELLKSNRMMQLKNLRVVIYGVDDGEYDADLEDLNSCMSYPIRLSDAVLLSRISQIPIYVMSDVMNRQGTPYSKQDMFTKSMPINILPSENLQEALKKAIDDEDYRLAQALSDELKRRK
ncbi:MAG: bifunctional nuclease domain-containing protein [Prevotella sp.]